MIAKIKSAGLKLYGESIEHLPVPLAVQALTRRMPRRFVIEPTNLCNHRCPLCPQPMQQREFGRMDAERFRGLADEIAPFARTICFTLLGEGLLHKEMFGLVKHAESLGIPCSLTTNGQLLEDQIDQVLDSNLTALKVTIDGIDKETHERYRVGSDFDKVKRGIEKLMAERRRRGLMRPNVNMLSLVFKFNEGQQDAIREWGYSIGVDKVGFKPVWVGGARYMNADKQKFADEYLPEDSKGHHDSWLKENLCRDFRVCPTFHEATILWNGDLVPCGRCAFDGRDAIGNVFTDGGFRAVWDSDKHRRKLATIIRKETDLCVGCDTPNGGKWLEGENLEPRRAPWPR
jgi:MoaA/NifB/PqqE/SkfB family radical SAM enzyme